MYAVTLWRVLNIWGLNIDVRNFGINSSPRLLNSTRNMVHNCHNKQQVNTTLIQSVLLSYGKEQHLVKLRHNIFNAIDSCMTLKLWFKDRIGIYFTRDQISEMILWEEQKKKTSKLDGPEIELNPIVPWEIEFKASQWGPFTPEQGKLGSISNTKASWGAYNPHEGFYSNIITHIALFPLPVFMVIRKLNEPYNSLFIVAYKSPVRRNFIVYFIVSQKLI